MPDMARRGIFGSLTSVVKKDKNVEKFPIRPPYNNNIELFHQECPNCENTPCVTVCEEEIIKIREDKTPYLNFSGGGCTFCKECAFSCPNEVLFIDEESKDALHVKVKINTSTCMAWDNVICSSCKDVCDERAIEFFGVFRPIIVTNKCTGCGFCYGVCPTYAVEITTKKGEV